MTKAERNKRDELRRNELVALLSERDNSRSLRRIISDKLLMIAGIIGCTIIVLWFACASILPLSYFGLIGRSDRYVVLEETGEIIVDNCSAFKSAWSFLTFGAREKMVPIYDMFVTKEPDVLMFIGGFGCTVLILALISGFVAIMSVYTKDFILIIKALIIIAKENNKDALTDMKHAITDIRNFAKLDEEKDRYVEVIIPGQKKKKEAEKTVTEKSSVMDEEVKTTDKPKEPRQVTPDEVIITPAPEPEKVEAIKPEPTREYTLDDLTADEIDLIATGVYNSPNEVVAARTKNSI